MNGFRQLLFIPAELCRLPSCTAPDAESGHQSGQPGRKTGMRKGLDAQRRFVRHEHRNSNGAERPGCGSLWKGLDAQRRFVRDEHRNSNGAERSSY